MHNNLGYNKKLFILPFDHRASFAKMLGLENDNLNQQEKEIIISSKTLIYEAFKKSISKGIPKNDAAILVDEEYGDKIIIDAKNQGYNVILTTEKSGQDKFNFEYGDKFSEHIEKYKPTFVKALIRYKLNADWINLKTLANYCNEKGYKFLLEVLSQIDTPTSDNMIPIINNLRENGIEPDIWKLEGMEKSEDYQKIAEKIQEGQRENVGLVILGRGESKEKVEHWIRMGRDVNGVIGFAIGRTIFWQPLADFKNGKIDKNMTIENISNNFLHFYNIFTNNDN